MSASKEASLRIDALPDRIITVTVPARVAFNLDSMRKVTAEILNRLGCPECHSGFDLRFRMVRDFAVDDKLNVRETPSGGVIIHG